MWLWSCCAGLWGQQVPQGQGGHILPLGFTTAQYAWARETSHLSHPHLKNSYFWTYMMYFSDMHR